MLVIPERPVKNFVDRARTRLVERPKLKTCEPPDQLALVSPERAIATTPTEAQKHATGCRSRPAFHPREVQTCVTRLWRGFDSVHPANATRVSRVKSQAKNRLRRLLAAPDAAGVDHGSGPKQELPRLHQRQEGMPTRGWWRASCLSGALAPCPDSVHCLRASPGSGSPWQKLRSGGLRAAALLECRPCTRS